MKMTNTIQTPFFPASPALPMPPRFEGFGSTRHEAPATEMRAGSRFDIQDAEGRVPEIICRVMLGLCLAFTFIECLIQLAAS
jgi:hypothetical protein